MMGYKLGAPAELSIQIDVATLLAPAGPNACICSVGISATVRDGEQKRTVAKANINVCNDFVSRCDEIKLGAGDENRTRVLSLGS